MPKILGKKITKIPSWVEVKTTLKMKALFCKCVCVRVFLRSKCLATTQHFLGFWCSLIFNWVLVELQGKDKMPTCNIIQPIKCIKLSRLFFCELTWPENRNRLTFIKHRCHFLLIDRIEELRNVTFCILPFPRHTIFHRLVLAVGNVRATIVSISTCSFSFSCQITANVLSTELKYVQVTDKVLSRRYRIRKFDFG